MPLSHTNDSHGLLSVGRAAQFCHVSEVTIRKWVDSDFIPGSYKLPSCGERRIPAPALVKFMSGRGIAVTPELLHLATEYNKYYLQ